MSAPLFGTDRARASVLHADVSIAVEPPSKKAKAFALMLEAADYATEIDCSPWDFAVEVNELRGIGLTNNDLRWLVVKGYVEHAREIAAAVLGTRRFRPAVNLDLSRKTCLILT